MTLKRMVDLFLSILGLILLLPLLALMSIAIFLESGFPILHRRKVHSSPTETFYFYKFRTMYKDADSRLEILLNNNPEIKSEYELGNEPHLALEVPGPRQNSPHELIAILL